VFEQQRCKSGLVGQAAWALLARTRDPAVRQEEIERLGEKGVAQAVHHYHVHSKEKKKKYFKRLVSLKTDYY